MSTNRGPCSEPLKIFLSSHQGTAEKRTQLSRTEGRAGYTDARAEPARALFPGHTPGLSPELPRSRAAASPGPVGRSPRPPRKDGPRSGAGGQSTRGPPRSAPRGVARLQARMRKEHPRLAAVTRRLAAHGGLRARRSLAGSISPVSRGRLRRSYAPSVQIGTRRRRRNCAAVRATPPAGASKLRGGAGATAAAEVKRRMFIMPLGRRRWSGVGPPASPAAAGAVGLRRLVGPASSDPLSGVSHGMSGEGHSRSREVTAGVGLSIADGCRAPEAV